MAITALVPHPLSDLATRIVAEHRAAEGAVGSAVMHAMAAGDLLIEAKVLCAHGEWEGWLTTHCAVGIRQAQTYMRLAHHRALIEAKTNRDSFLSLNGAKALLDDSRPKPPSARTFNRTNANVDWAWWTWNPVTGCLHNCVYCYAREIAERFYEEKFAPTFHPERLEAPRHTKVPDSSNPRARRVFTCSMADLFGKWVPQEWIDAVFAQVWDNPQWEFLFLTKFPQRLAELEWPANAWVGTSVDQQHRVAIAEKAFRGVTAGVKWLSCEPMLERLTFSSLEMFDWVVIGAQSATNQPDGRHVPEFQPEWEWVLHLIEQARAAGCKIYIKDNLKALRDEPRMRRGQ